MKTVPFLREHLGVMDVRNYEQENVVPFLNSSMLTQMETSGWAYTLVKDGRLVACLGGVRLWPGVWEIWQIPSVYVHKYSKSYCQTILGILDKGAVEESVWRYQTHSPADELHDRWMEFIGFECEGTMKEYTRARKDFRIWARRYNHGS